VVRHELARSDRAHAEDERGRRAPTGAMAVMRSVEVVEAHELLERALERRPAGEVVPAEHQPPALVQNRLLKPFDEPVRPGMPPLGARVADADGGAGLIEGPLELVVNKRVPRMAVQGPDPGTLVPPRRAGR